MYCNALDFVGPYEPCFYGPAISHAIKMTKEDNSRSMGIVYTVLLIVPGRDFSDFPEVANLICAAAELPLSIVIVGVGNSRLVQLERLDGDDEPLCSTDGTPCARDIGQFVQFHRHRYNSAQLAKEVLDEIPEQLVSYMRSKGLKPGDLPPASPAQPMASRRQGSTSQGPSVPGNMSRMNSSASGIGSTMPIIGQSTQTPSLPPYPGQGQQQQYPAMFEKSPTYLPGYNRSGQSHAQNSLYPPQSASTQQQSY